VLDLPADPPPVTPSIFPAGARVEKLADGFYSLGGGAADAAGTLYFTDRRHQRIYSWSAERKLSIVRDNTLDPINLAVDGAGNLLVLSSDGRDGTVYSFKPGSPDTEVTVIPPTPAADHAGAATVLPVNWWNNGEFKDQLDPETYQFTTLAEMFARDMARRSRGNTSRRTAAWSCRPTASSSRGRPTSGGCASRTRSTPTASPRPSRGSGCSSPTARRTRPIAAGSEARARSRT
jgi:hypothetical protein